MNAWRKLHKANPNSHGVSGITITSFKNNLDEQLLSIQKKLRSGTFSFGPNRAVAILKQNGNYRPLQIPEIQDRVVLKSLAIELEERFNQTIQQSKNVSFAYQKKVGIRDAINKMVSLYDSGYSIVLEADIINYFGEVDKNRLLHEQIFPNLPDDSINSLISSGLSQKVEGVSKLPKEAQKAFDGIENGIPQGNALSPLLSNIFLSPFDQFLIKRNRQLIRYADDFIVLCKDKTEALTVFNESKEFLKNELDLELHSLDSDKSKIVDPKLEEFIFLSIQFDGNEFYPSSESFNRLKNKILSLCNSKGSGIDVINLLIKIKNRLEGWTSAYYYTDMGRYVSELDFFVDRQLYLALRKFKWNFVRNTLGTIPRKFKKHKSSRDCMSRIQRKHSGIPLVKNLLEEKRQNDPLVYQKDLINAN